MGHVHHDVDGCEVECPDCGQRFPNDNLDSDDHIFKKPTIISRVVRRILNPFSSPEPEPVTSTHDEQRRHRRSKAKLRDKRRFGDLDRRNEFDYSESGSSLCSPSATAWKRSRTIESEDSFYQLPRGMNKVKPHKTVRHPFEDLNSRPNFNESTATPPSKRYRDFYFDDDCESTYVKADRLNLEKYVQPQRSPQEVVRAWVNDHQDCDPIDSLLTPDLSCDCKSVVKLEKDKMINDFLAQTRESFQRIQKSLENIKLFPREKVSYSDRKNAVSAHEQIKAVIADCANSQHLILDFLQKRS